MIPKRLLEYGFKEENGIYSYEKILNNSGFILTVTVTSDGKISTKTIDPAFGDVYTLHLSKDAAGAFIGSVRTEYEEILDEIARKCFMTDVYKYEQTKEIIEYAREKYGDEPEFLWKRFDDNSVLRRQDTKKWYAALLTVSRRKLGLQSDEVAEIIDLRYPPEKIEALIDGEKYFGGWHMNKKNWYTIILDGSVPLNEIFRRIDESYVLATQ